MFVRWPVTHVHVVSTLSRSTRTDIAPPQLYLPSRKLPRYETLYQLYECQSVSSSRR